MDNTLFGNQFENLINDDADTKSLLSELAKKQIGIISPTVKGLLDTFTITRRDELGIDSCSVRFEDSKINQAALSQEMVMSMLSKDNKESAQDASFVKSALTLVDKVEIMRSSFLPNSFSEYTSGETKNAFLKMESYENVLLRMIGFPDDKDLADDGENQNSKIFYLDPTDAKIKVTTLDVILGNTTATGIISGINDILLERRKNSSGGFRRYSFDKVATTISQENYKTLDDLAKAKTDEEIKKIMTGMQSDESGVFQERAKLIQSGPGTENIKDRLNYYNPKYLPAFYYLKIPCIQDSLIYGCVSEPSKVVLKPFDESSFIKINGITPQKCLLETIIRIRLDRITGDPGIYPSVKESSEGSGFGSFKSAKNKSYLKSDEITQVECFLIEKLKTILFQLGDEYRKSSGKNSDAEAKKNNELGMSEEKKTEGYEESVKQLSDQEASKLKSESESYLRNLEMLKAREDAILFLLKDKSSSAHQLDSAYSSLGLQEGIIRTSSGFDDALSGPLYSILSQRSEFYGRKISEAKRLIDALSSEDRKLGPDRKPGEVLSTYIGVSPEDLVIYCIALLSIEQDYLIGLLSKEKRVILVNTISESIISSGNDPYGLKRRLDLPPNNGGFPKILDSVNALTLLVSKIYLSYIDYLAGIDPSKEKLYRQFLYDYEAAKE